MKPHEARTRPELVETARQYPDRTYLFFWGHTPQQEDQIDRSCLSQWYPAAFRHDRYLYRTAEHYMMAQKALLFRDHEAFRAILDAASPREAKRLGRAVRGFEQAIWDRLCCNIVTAGNQCKFDQHPELRNWLLRTRDAILVEASPYDRVWGIGIKADHPDAQQPHRWPGQNLLGFCLMRVRDRLMESPK